MGITAAQARKLCEQAGAPLPDGMSAGNFEKVSNTRRKVLDGIEFRSTLEADVYKLLKAWESIGEIRALECQKVFVLQPKMRRDGKALRAITYVSDFAFERLRSRQPKDNYPRLWASVVIDAKGFRMPVYRIKAKIFKALYPEIVFEEWTRETLKANGG